MSLGAIVPVISSILSAKVDFPWSMCAMILKLRILDGIVVNACPVAPPKEDGIGVSYYAEISYVR